MTGGLWPALLKVLPQVARPVRYIDSEHNCVPIDVETAGVSFCLIYPDAYEVGMSNLGLGILYDILNRTRGVVADRAFVPWPDMEERMRAAALPLFGLASRKPLGDFDVLAITLQYEMTYANVLTVLDLAGVPLRAAERDESHPLVLGGGPCAANPEPVAPFFDAILVGDGEEAIVEITEVLRRAKAGGACRRESLAELARVRGVYVPGFYEPRYRRDGRIAEVACVQAGVPRAVTRRILADLDAASVPTTPIVPFADVVHDRVALEIMRGCTRGCRFCQAGMVYRPLRERDPNRLMEAAERLIAATGYEDLSLVSLSSSDYSCVAELVQGLCARFAGTGTSLSLPSGRVDAFSVALARSIAGLKKTGLTFAPEAGTQRLRDVINKKVTQDDFERTIAEAFSSGWKRVKLYFMIGLPTETDDDVAGIAETISAGARVARANGAGGGPIFNVSVSSLVPKAGSPFQWASQDGLETVWAKQGLLRARVSRKAAKLHWHDAKLSMLEGVLARGDRKLADVIECAWRAGCRLDAWTEHFDFERWLRAFEETGVDPAAYLRRRDEDEIFPWEHISSGVSRAFLLDEWHKSLDGQTTGDCRTEGCTGCGVCGGGVDNVINARAPAVPVPSDGETVPHDTAAVQPELWRVRVRYAKAGPLRFLSHLEVCHAIERAVRRASLPVAVTRGFSPKMRVSYGPPLPVGAAGLTEYFDVFLNERAEPDLVAARLRDALPDGLDVAAAALVGRSAPSITAAAVAAAYDVSVWGENLDLDAVRAELGALIDQETVEMTRKSRSIRVHLSEVVRDVGMPEVSAEGLTQRITVTLGGAQHLRPEVLLVEALERCGAEHEPVVVTRTGLFAETENGLIDVMEVGQ